VFSEMICRLIFFSLLGFCLNVEVHQSSSEITDAKKKVQIFCSYDKSDFRVMLWYRQTPGRTDMDLIGYLNYKEPKMEEKYEKTFAIAGDLSVNTLKTGSLSITAAEAGNSAVYFCAASRARR
uniref:Immunoglobulin V-set domain-containing protein n=1 Tax=Oryzias sinensis TaxID=183150 RepID=A0A8C8DN51_9TELE